ncbi:MAG: alkaline phosphatase [Phycisphaerales bacterium]|nr:alkaline phosphatase [Phycisphaerales bacterium]
MPAARILAALIAPAALALAPPLAAGAPPKNIIVFIADGGGANAHRAFELWRGEPALYRGPGWFRGSAATYALRLSPRPGASDPLAQDPRIVYDPAKAWDATPSEGGAGGYPSCFAGYRWLLATAPDSANTASAIFTGVPTYRGAIDVDGAGNPTRTVAEAASERGKAVGIVTSVPFSHATPAAAAGAHVPDRDMYHEIAHQMLTAGVCDVIAGAGHPDFDDSGAQRAKPAFDFVSEEDWKALRAGTLTQADGATWTLVDDTQRIASFSSGEVPSPLIMVPRVGQTLQERRAARGDAHAEAPGESPRNADLPTLADLSLAALNGIDDDPDGFFLMIEGGAVDWAEHDNRMGRLIEEMTDFHDTIEAVCRILDAGDRGYDWSNTLVIVTADHDHLLWGPESDTIPFQPLTDNGPGQIPGYRWLFNSHSNQPVPLFARGAGAGAFAALPSKPDVLIDTSGATSRTFERPPYFHQSEIGKTLMRFVAAQGEAPTAATKP